MKYLDPGHAPLKFHPLANLVPMLSDSELADLGDDIRANGQVETVKLHRGMVLDGRNRYTACARKNIGVHSEIFEGTDRDALNWVISKNLKRRHLTESQRAMVAARLATLRPGDNQYSAQAAPIGAPSFAIVSQSDAAEMLSIGRRSVQRAVTVQEKGALELQEAVDAGAIAVSVASYIAERPADEQMAILESLPRDESGKLTPEAKKALAPIIKEVRAEKQIEKKEKRAERIRELGDKHRALPDRKFGVILADPEWHFDVWSEETGQDRAAANHYPTSTIEVIKSRPVAAIAADECVLGLWATVPNLPAALDVMCEWGFTYVSQIVWVKDRIGTGYWFRNNHEILLIGKKGAPPKPSDGTQWRSAIQAARAAHSEKPDFQYEFFETFFPGWPAIELNARRARAGWIQWGNEAPEPEQPSLNIDRAEDGAA